MHSNKSTYRFQFHKDFTLKQAIALAPYLNELGIETLYASPIFTAVPGSMHGYDSMDPAQINPEIGSIKEYRKLSKTLKEYGIGLMQDIVPNHMAFDARNPWIKNLLEYGKISEYARFFDIFYAPSSVPQRLMLPFLGDTLSDAILKKDISVSFQDDRLGFNYFENFWPLAIESYNRVLSLAELPGKEFQQLLSEGKEHGHLLSEIKKDGHLISESKEHGHSVFLDKFLKVFQDSTNRKKLDSALIKLSADKDLLEEISSLQFYRLCSWRESDHVINFRRFFTVNSLICLNIQKPLVFEKFHRFTKKLLHEHVISALRIDHIDGLYDPARYLQQLRELAGDHVPIYVEKILGQKEILDPTWPVQGSTGYDYLAKQNNLFTYGKSRESFLNYSQDFGEKYVEATLQLRLSKTAFLKEHMSGELENLTALFICAHEPDLIDGFGAEKNLETEKNQIKEALKEIMVRMPVYRFYGNSLPLPNAELEDLGTLISAIKKEKPALNKVLSLIENSLLNACEKIQLNSEIRIVQDENRSGQDENRSDQDENRSGQDEKRSDQILEFYQRLMQFTGPLMAKGVEDTIMYTSNRFIGHNEVGDSPFEFGISTVDFHDWISQRFVSHPLDMNATSTHDTKRGEDVRARLNVLSAIPETWQKNVTLWKKANERFKNEHFPGDDFEYFIYQNIAGSYPVIEEERVHYLERFNAYLQKAIREGNIYSSWSNPALKIENAVKEFVCSILDTSNSFYSLFLKFQSGIKDHGYINSLSQVTLKCMLPGIPDIYQGCELWDFSLVDPDNRRPVDFSTRMNFLEKIRSNAENIDKTSAQNRIELLTQLWSVRETGEIKLFLTQFLLNIRKSMPEFFDEAPYLPVTIKGSKKEEVFAFIRKKNSDWILVIVPLFTARLKFETAQLPGLSGWDDTEIILPEDAPENFRNVISNQEYVKNESLKLNDLLQKFPVAILKSTASKNVRSAGLLMHITSLPSAYGIGDLGPEAYNFVNFLKKGKQRIWQFLPIGPNGPSQSYSPYSAFSSFAGNTLLISLDLLAESGLIDTFELLSYQIKPKSTVDFGAAKKIKDYFLEKAYHSFITLKAEDQLPFKTFCFEEGKWLDDFTLFVILKSKQGGKPWYDWPVDFRDRAEASIERFVQENAQEIEKAKWRQYVFFSQWKLLRTYAFKLDITFFGDLPFYSAYDSCDVWVNRDSFLLDSNGSRLAQAGVPPDYFNADGQLWGMPVYNWKNLEKDGFKWWLERIEGTINLFDKIRLDHFRAMYDYWEIPGNESSARNGKWEKSFGKQLLDTLQVKYPSLPFIAEDLGEMEEEVFALRSKYALPGMKVLQFAFGRDSANSAHILHHHERNFIVYTGTHDNNTTLGWFKNDLGDEGRLRLQNYCGKKIRNKDVHLALIQMAYSSVANTVIIPVQDILGLDEASRMNIPASVIGNWSWRMKRGSLNSDISALLAKWTEIYNRY